MLGETGVRLHANWRVRATVILDRERHNADIISEFLQKQCDLRDSCAARVQDIAKSGDPGSAAAVGHIDGKMPLAKK
jgi:hypothetical protein